MFGVGDAVRALGLGPCPRSGAASRGVHSTPHSPGTQAAIEGLLTMEEAKRLHTPGSTLSAENMLTALSTSQSMEPGVTAPHQRGLLCYYDSFFGSDRQSQNLCFLELLALLFR